jgi:ABC-2 type transport system ATP-binding protein
MFFIQKLTYPIGNLPVTINNIRLEAGTINVILGKNCSGKTSFCEAIVACNPSNEIYVNRHKINTKDFVYLDPGVPSFFGVTGNELLKNYGGSASEEKVKELKSLFQIPYDQQIESYSHSMKKIIQLLWVATYERKVYIFDDLFSLLDEDHQRRVKAILALLREESKIIILTAHNLDIIGDIANEVFSLTKSSLEQRVEVGFNN